MFHTDVLKITTVMLLALWRMVLKPIVHVESWNPEPSCVFGRSAFDSVHSTNDLLKRV